MAPAAPASAATVTKTADTNDNVCSPADCSLREAVFVTNGSVDNTITLPPGTYQLTLGELDVTDEVTIDGDDDLLPNIVASANSRVFHLTTQSFDDVVLQDLVISGGNVSASGGGIANDVGSGSLTVVRSRVTGNTASPPFASNQGGGGIYQGSSAALNIEDSTIDTNTANVSGTNNGGGGVYSQGFATIQNSTIDVNSLNGSGPNSGGGGLFSNNGGDVFTHVTLTFNASALGGASIYHDGGMTGILLQNTILDTGANNNCAGGFFSTGGGNLEFGDTCNLASPPADLPNTHPTLGALQDNGGPTPTRAPPATSAVINTANGGNCCRARH